jgi:hypothetical protein
MNENLDHLLPSAQLLANDSDELRIRRIRTDRWIGYPRAESALMELEDLLSFPQRTRMPNFLLIGPTNNGKSMVVEKFRRLRATDRPGDDPAALASRMQVLTVQCRRGPMKSGSSRRS